MQQIADWLEKLGMSEYAERFAENDIDISVLRHLTDQDLKDIGVVARASAENAGGDRGACRCRSALAAACVNRAEDPRHRRAPPSHGDVLGPRRLDGALGAHGPRGPARGHFGLPEMRRRDRARFGGFVAKYMGDGVLIYFGYPQAHEDDAERAVRAGLELIAAVSALKSPVALQTRVGIATGLVVVGDLIGSGEAQERGIVGETPNLAARLQGIAEPNMVVIAESTRKLLGNLFELEDLGAQGPQGHRRASAGVGGAATEFGRRPLRGAARERPDRTCRAGRRTRTAAAALVEGKDRRRPSGAAFR